MKTVAMPIPGNWQEMPVHELADIVEYGTGIHMPSLIEHMQANGYDETEPIIIYDNKIFDGRHRRTAAITAGVTPTFKTFVGKNPLAYITKKILRQHLSDSQRAMLAAAIATLRNGQKASESTSAILQSTLTDVHTDDPDISTVTQSQAADMLNVSTRSVNNARKVINKGVKELQESVKDGSVTVSDAAKIVSEAPAVQEAAVAAVREGAVKTVAAATQEKLLCRSCRTKGSKPNCRDCQKLNEGRVLLPPAPRTPPPVLKTTPAQAATSDTTPIANVVVDGTVDKDLSPALPVEHVFDNKGFLKSYEQAIGSMMRLIDAVGNQFGVKESKDARGFRDSLGTYNKNFRSWCERFGVK